MKKIQAAALAAVAVLVLAACSGEGSVSGLSEKNEELARQLEELQAENSLLEGEYGRLKSALQDIAAVPAEDELAGEICGRRYMGGENAAAYRFPAEAEELKMPSRLAYSMLRPLAAVHSGRPGREGEYWVLASWRDYGDAGSTVGWVRKSDLLEYTEETKALLVNPLEVEESDNWGAIKEEKLYGSWEEAYRDILCNIKEYRLDPYKQRYSYTFWIWLALHDFEGDGVPELITGDDWAVSVFSFRECRIEKVADVIPLEEWKAFNAFWVMDNTFEMGTGGSDGSGRAALSYQDGRYILGQMCDYHPKETVIDGISASPEKFIEIFGIEDFFELESIERARESGKLRYLDKTFLDMGNDCIRIYEEGYPRMQQKYEEVKIDESFPWEIYLW